MVIFPLKMVIFPLKMVIFPLKMVIFPLKMVIFPLKMVIFPLKMVIFLVAICHSSGALESQIPGVSGELRRNSTVPGPDWLRTIGNDMCIHTYIYIYIVY